MKRYLALTVAVCLVLTMSIGCSPTGQNNPTTTTTTTTTTTPSSTDSAEDSTTTTETTTTTQTTLPASSDNVANTGTIPGTENWSDVEGAYTIVIDDEESHEFEYYGIYATHPYSLKYTMLTEEQREIVNKVIFDDLGVGWVGCNFPFADYHTAKDHGYDVRNFGDTLGLGKGSLIEEGLKRGLAFDICCSIRFAPYMYAADGQLDDQYVDQYAKMMARAVYDIKETFGYTVDYVGTGDEPDFDESTRQYQLPLIVKKARQYLDQYGLTSTKIVSAECCNLRLNDWVHPLYQDQEAWKALGGLSGHDFNTGVVDPSLAQAASAWNKKMYSTSSGYDGLAENVADWVKYDAAGTLSVEDYMKAIQNSSAIMNDTNLGTSGYLTFNAVFPVDATWPSGNTNFAMVYFDPTGGTNLGELYAISANYKYVKQLNETIDQGATMHKAYRVTDDGAIDWMSDITVYNKYQLTNKLSVNAGQNPDGTWGINLLNKTDSDVTSKYYQQTQKPQPAETITVNLDVRSLYGTGVQEFEMISITPGSTVSESVGTVTLVDGRGTVDVFPFELLSLRSVNSVNHLYDSKENVFDNSAVLYNGYDFALINGQKKKLVAKPYREVIHKTNGDDYQLAMAVEDIATIMGVSYKRDGDTLTIFDDYGKITLTVGNDIMQYSGGSTLVSKVTEKDGVPMLVMTNTVQKLIADEFGVFLEDISASIGLMVVHYGDYAIDTPVTNLYQYTAAFE